MLSEALNESDWSFYPSVLRVAIIEVYIDHLTKKAVKFLIFTGEKELLHIKKAF